MHFSKPILLKERGINLISTIKNNIKKINIINYTISSFKELFLFIKIIIRCLKEDKLMQIQLIPRPKTQK